MLCTLWNVYAQHVSAKDITILKSPSLLLRHNALPHLDKVRWDAAYAEEYYGLQALGTWEGISEEDFQRLKTTIKSQVLPTMVIFTLKYSGDGKPVRCKYRIVVLGNLDTHNWSKEDCFAPVLSQLEHRALLGIAT